MRLKLHKPTQVLNKAYARQSISHSRMDTFRRALERLFSRVDENESDEYQRTIVAGFLTDAFYSDPFEVSPHEGIDLVIYQKPDQPGAFIETKRVFAGDMMTPIKNNVRALHELVLHYFEERERHPARVSSHLIVTDVYNWFIFDETDFRHFFYNNARLRKLYQLKQQQKKDTTFFYTETARILRELDDEVPVTYLNLREAADALGAPPEQGNQFLIPVFKLLSPEHLLKRPFANDANTLNQGFYDELLHLVGLHETANGGLKRIQRLPEDQRLDGSLLENTIAQLKTRNALIQLDNPDLYGINDDDRLVNVGLGLCFTWLGRLLFLKLLEGQLIRYHHGDRAMQFLTSRHIRAFGELNELFFDVLAVPESRRSASIANRYGPVPYLSSSLFELTELERQTLTINDLSDHLSLPLFGQTALRDQYGQHQAGHLPALQYLLAFLDAYDFSCEGPALVQADNKPLMNAAMLGLIVEKLSGYRDGSFFTPGFVSMYLVRDSLRRAVLTRFNERFGWACPDLVALAKRLSDVPITDANAVINSLRIVDPAVGSGHFLVSALNELIALKAELGILADRDGRRLSHHTISLVNDELLIADEAGQPFHYVVPAKGRREKGDPKTSIPVVSESQRVQEMIFHEKQTLIENCLFGVDSNPNALTFARLRLWMELLKNVYYVGSRPKTDRKKEATPADHAPAFSLQTLPNLDINLKAGHSLVSRFRVDYRVDSLRNQSMRDRFLPAFQRYRFDVLAYKSARDKASKESIRDSIGQFREYINQMALVDQKDYVEIRQLETRLAQSALTFDFVGHDDRLPSLTDQLESRKQAFADKQRVFRQAFEWRFEFPEVLDEQGSFVGFDVVMGHPPQSRPNEFSDYKALFGKAFPNTYAAAAPLYVLFVEQGLNLLRPGGQLAYVLPDNWMQAGYATNLRKWLKTKAVEQITDFGDQLVLGESTAPVNLLAIRNADTTGTLRAAQIDALQTSAREGTASPADRFIEVPVASLQDKGWVLADTRVQNLLARLRQTGKPLKDYVYDKIFYGLKTGLNDAFVISEKTRARLVAQDPRSAEVIKPFLTSRDIHRYQPLIATKYLIVAGRGMPMDTYPAILAHLEPYKERLMLKRNGRKSTEKSHIAGMDNWYELPETGGYYAEFAKPHLLVSSLSREVICTWNGGGVYSNDKTIIVATDSKYVLAVMNSRVAGFVLRQLSLPGRNNGVDYQPVHMAQIPIPDASAQDQALLIELVDAILTAKRDDPGADTSVQESAIDARVSDLFGLTVEERAVIMD